MKKKILITSAAGLLFTPTMLVACNDDQKAQEAKYDQDFKAQLTDTRNLLDTINKTEMAPDFFVERTKAADEIEKHYNNAKTSADKYGALYELQLFHKKLVNNWTTELAHILSNANFKYKDVIKDSEATKLENEKLKVDLDSFKIAKGKVEDKLKETEAKLKEAQEYNGKELDAEIKNLTKDYLPRQLSGKEALLEAQDYLINWYDALITMLRHAKYNDENTKNQVLALADTLEQLMQSTKLAKEQTLKTPERFETRKEFRMDLAITMDRIKKLGIQYEPIFKFDLPWPKSKYLTALFEWRVANFDALYNDIKNNDPKVYAQFLADGKLDQNSPEFQKLLEEFKKSVLLTLENLKNKYVKAEANAKYYADQVFAFVTYEETLQKYKILKELALDQWHPQLKSTVKMSEYPLYGRLYDSDTTKKLDVFYKNTLTQLSRFWASEGDKYLNSIAYRKIYKVWDEYLKNSLNYKYNMSAHTYYEFLGTFAEAQMGIQQLVVPDTHIQEQTNKVKAEITKLNEAITKLLQPVYKAASKELSDDASYTPWYNLREELNGKFSKAKRMPESNFVELFDKYIALMLAKAYTENMLDIYNHYELVGIDPTTAENDEMFKLKSKPTKLQKKLKQREADLNDAKLEDEFYKEFITPLFDKVEWPNFEAANMDEAAKIAAYKKLITELHTAFEGVAKVNTEEKSDKYKDSFFREYFYEDFFESKAKEINDAFSKLDTVTTFGWSQKSFASDMKKFWTGRLQTIQDELQAKEADYKVAKENYEKASSDTVDPKNYTVPNQELYAFIRQWNLKYRPDLAAVLLNPEKEVDKGALDLFKSYNSEWNFTGHQDTSTKPYIHITNLDIDDIENTDAAYNGDQVMPQYTPDKVKVNLLAAEQKYFAAYEAYITAKKAEQDTAELKTKLDNARKDYYAVLNDPHYQFSKNAYAKFDPSQYESGKQVQLTQLKLASLYASEVASYEVLDFLNKKYMK
ncbi:hypothetical protein [Mycoplasma hafezii]|uniref:hypothetical protein n=1 Tax=Mycoplasma hafezii TaxID=525886 RepID=UPI003CEA89DE